MQISQRTRRIGFVLLLAALGGALVLLLAQPGCSRAAASPGSYPDYGIMLNVSGTSIQGSGGSYTTGTAFFPANITRISGWVKITLASGSNLANLDLRFTCGYSAATDVLMPVTYSDQATPTVNTTTTLAGTVGATVWHVLQTGAITGARSGCQWSTRSSNASAGGTGDTVQVYVYGY